jgi:putative ABC transport system substrate-binding protein
MRRREFIAVVGATAAWPLTARAQSPAMPLIGFLSSRSPAESAHHTAAFLRGLRETGYIEGQNVAVQYRWAEGKYDRLPALAAELVALPLAALAAPGGTPSALAAKAATASVPIIFLSGDDPVRAGLVVSFNRPGGNVTGVSLISTELGTKRVGLLCELVPTAKVIALFLNPNDPDAESHRQDVQMAVDRLRRRLIMLHASTETEFDAIFATLAQQGVGAMVVENDPFFDTQRNRLVALAAQYAVPAIYHIREFPAAGGLMSYGASLTEAYHQLGVQTAQILKGSDPRDVPVVRPTRFELVINIKTAKALGLDVPDKLLALADEVIE